MLSIELRKSSGKPGKEKIEKCTFAVAKKGLEMSFLKAMR
jgi:hypothetical protein